MNRHQAIVVFIFLGLAPLFAGCDEGSYLERLPMHGTVTLANGEKPNGSITFLPAKGATGPAATTTLVEGSYQFDRRNGPMTGSKTVIVKRFVPRANVLQTLTNKKAIPQTKTEWTQSVEVSDDGQYLHDFIVKD